MPASVMMPNVLAALARSSPVHVLETLQQLIQKSLDKAFLQVVSPSFDEFINVAFHQLEDESQATRGSIAAQHASRALQQIPQVTLALQQRTIGLRTA